jgi:hypothetical protein
MRLNMKKIKNILYIIYISQKSFFQNHKKTNK